MAYVCQSCNLFCSFEAEEEPGVNDESVEQDGTVRLSVSVSYVSGCCGDEVATAEYELEDEVGIEHVEDGCDASALSLEVLSIEATDRFQETDRHGKPIKSHRYRRHYYGVEAEVRVSCDKCGAAADATLKDEVGPPESVY